MTPALAPDLARPLVLAYSIAQSAQQQQEYDMDQEETYGCVEHEERDGEPCTREGGE